MSAPKTDDRDEHRRRLAEALRANLRRRKTQARARAESVPESLRPEDETDPQEG